jgi:hypothetical protein
LLNVTYGKVRSTERIDYGNIIQWVVPYAPRQRIAVEIVPDLVHVWGTENYWGLLTERNRFPYPALLGSQDSKYAIASKMFGELTFSVVGIPLTALTAFIMAAVMSRIIAKVPYVRKTVM